MKKGSGRCKERSRGFGDAWDQEKGDKAMKGRLAFVHHCILTAEMVEAEVHLKQEDHLRYNRRSFKTRIGIYIPAYKNIKI
ncbi:hypothetical protein Y1Q_0017542 [Alligator mississippiensis]|uniref:Uncharacterized protein n=1 Tax=Alligator mississippiensis TaxID=8496 RepID=A0A151P2B7_ALLMI|nr:hypothetical protein Y1Q_0017542 [Alligator mississippiensis]